MTERAAIELTGLVQGVGFRPFVHSLATQLDLRGFVQNRGGHVLVDVEGDAAAVSMAAFPPCLACAREYADPSDRRFHAQGICCPACGPRLFAREASQLRREGEAALRLAVDVLAAGGIVAVKGIGGFHLACDARNDTAVAELRRRKRREGKPFAVMLPWPDGQALAATLPAQAGAALLSAERPIVLLDWREVATAPGLHLSRHVAPGTSTIGVFLPYSPLHHLLLADMKRPLVMTSGNRRDEPMACDDAAAEERLGAIADLFLSHDRAILRRCDDSVTRVAAGRVMPVRRGRGQAPEPLTLAEASARTILAVGADLKNAFCFVDDSRAYLSAHVGNLDSAAGFQALADSVAQQSALLKLDPAVIVHDRHPDFLSTGIAGLYPDAERVAVQHHHAHVLSCVAEHRCTGPVIGVAFDGAGLGDDGAVWGGEFLVVEGTRVNRAAYLSYVPLPGGDAAAREPWRMALAHLAAAGLPPSTTCYQAIAGRVPALKVNLVAQLIEKGTCSPPTSSVGRLFDAVASLVGLRDTVEYEGQAAMALEAVATAPGACRYAFDLDTSNEPWRIEAASVIRGVAADVEARRHRGEIAAAFHHALADGVVLTATRLARRTGIRTIALTGGAFQNARLSGATAAGLRANGMYVLEHSQVPCNDGGLSLGQALFALRLLREREFNGETLTCA
jgi:hydrogenase maturation protein HypF